MNIQEMLRHVAMFEQISQARIKFEGAEGELRWSAMLGEHLSSGGFRSYHSMISAMNSSVCSTFGDDANGMERRLPE